MKQHTAASTLFPYTTLFRSGRLSRGLVSDPVRDGSGEGAEHVDDEVRGRAGVVEAEVRTSGDDRMVRRSEEHTSELQSLAYLVCRLLLEKKNSRLNQFGNTNAEPRSCSTMSDA